MGQTKNPETHCRPDQLFGLWCIEPKAFEALVEIAKTADLQALRSAPALPEPPPYQVDASGLAQMSISGPMTKYPTSFQGLTGGTSTLKARQALREATMDPAVKAIALRVESPGGTLVGTQELADAVKAADGKKPVYAFVDDQAGSAAYWVASQARKVYANATAQVGSIGCFAVLKDESGAYEQKGVKVHVVTSKGGVFKGAGTPGTPITEDVLAEVQTHLDAANEFFLKGVSTGRRIPLERVRELADGRTHFAQAAKDLGLIDTVASVEDGMAEVGKVMEQNEAVELRASLEAERQEKATLQEQLSQFQAMAADMQALKASNEALMAEKRGARFKAEAEAIGVPEAFAKVLDNIEAKCGGETFTALVTQLKASVAQDKAAELFSEKGTSTAPVSGNAADQIEALAAQIVKDGKATTHAEAIRMASKNNPDIATKFLQEQRKARQ